MKTLDGVLERCMNPDSALGFDADALMDFLPFEKVKQFLKEGVTEEEWKKNSFDLTRENVLKVMKDYMTFALGKAEDHRGLSAGRSIEKMQAWVWILDEEDKIDWDNYKNYGAPILRQICKLYKFEFPMDNKSLVNMSEGKSCRAGCGEGCGR